MDVVATLLFWLLVMHALCDYPLQGDFLGQGKARINMPTVGMPWWICLAAHCLIQAGGTATAFRLIGFDLRDATAFGAAELVLHVAIDYAKIRKYTGPIQDQALHIACKVGYAAFVWQAM